MDLILYIFEKYILHYEDGMIGYPDFSVDFLEPISDFRMSVYFYVNKNTKCGCSFSYLDCKEHF